MPKIKKINKIKVDVTIMHEDDKEYNNQDTMQELQETLGLIALCIQSTHNNLNDGNISSARLSMLCVDSWAKRLYDGLAEIEREEE